MNFLAAMTVPAAMELKGFDYLMVVAIGCGLVGFIWWRAGLAVRREMARPIVPVMPPEPQFYLDLAGVTSGPFSMAQLRELYRLQSIRPETLWCSEGMTEWRPIADMLPAILAPPAAGAPGARAASAVVRRSHRKVSGGWALQLLGLALILVGFLFLCTIITPLICWPLGFWLISQGGASEYWLACATCGSRVESQEYGCPQCRNRGA